MGHGPPSTEINGEHGRKGEGELIAYALELDHGKGKLVACMNQLLQDWCCCLQPLPFQQITVHSLMSLDLQQEFSRSPEKLLPYLL